MQSLNWQVPLEHLPEFCYNIAMNTIPHRGVVWHAKQKSWRVVVKKMDHTVTPSRKRYFYKEFPDLETAVAVRDYVSRMLHGPNARLNVDGVLPHHVTRLDVIQWLVAQGTIDPNELDRFTSRVLRLDKLSLPR